MRENLRPERATFDYDRLSDTLMVYFEGSRPAVSDPVGDHLYLRLDVETEDIVGFQMEDFLLCVVRDHPVFLEIAELAGVPADEIAAMRDSIPSAVRKGAALDAVFGQLADLSSSPEELAREQNHWTPLVLAFASQ